jgi:hypothetical protein
MKRSSLACLGLGVLLSSIGARAAGLDGSAPLVCDLTKAAECDGVAACSGVAMEQIDLPSVILVDFAGSRLASAGDERTSPITAVEKLDDVLVLQGRQNGRGWTMVIDRATGHLSATLADVEGAFVLAGACSAK